MNRLEGACKSAYLRQVKHDMCMTCGDDDESSCTHTHIHTYTEWWTELPNS